MCFQQIKASVIMASTIYLPKIALTASQGRQLEQDKAILKKRIIYAVNNHPPPPSLQSRPLIFKGISLIVGSLNCPA